ncbi:MAG: phosphoesterase [Alphaproteobacteria bacterium]|nr:phosphoesterase [Alphaproteobacteria bacterium]
MLPSAMDRRGRRCFAALSVVASTTVGLGMPAYAGDPDPSANKPMTATPIKHVIVVIGENRSFDHVYGTYVPKSGDRILNLLSQGIVRPDGSPGPNFAAASQFSTSGQTSYFIGVSKTNKTAYTNLPAPTLGGAPNEGSATAPPFIGLTDAQLAAIEPSLEPNDLSLLTTGATGADATSGAPDTRITNSAALPNGPFQLTGPTLPYDSYTGDTTHRFYQMWQQSDCSIGNASEDNPAGCLNDLYPFVITTYGGPADHGGGTSMAFYNVQQGDAPLFKKLADQYTISDNYHQPGQGGTGLQHVLMGTGDDIYWSDGNGNPTVPPSSQIANPNPQSGTNNDYTVDGRFSNCSDLFNAPGVLPVVRYLDSLPYPAQAHCEADRYYMLNNTNPGFLPNGAVDTQGIASGASIPPSSVRTIGDALNDNGISWAYYGGAYNAAVNLANGSTDPADAVGAAYCNICNFESYASSIMGDPAQRTEHIKDATDFYAAVGNGTLPAVSFVKPDGLLDGHPATSKVDLFEGMLQKILDTLDANPELQSQTALFITLDEGGGYYDSGFLQPVDFFGDGPRIPLVVVSPYSKGGHVVHSYTDHVSILKFIERNWGLQPLTGRSRDNLPNPRADKDSPYVPMNMPAIGDLFDMFNFGHRTGNGGREG